MGIGGLDFGTSNSAMGIYDKGAIKLSQLSDDNFSMPTALFFNGGSREYTIGSDALLEYSKGERGRMIISIKRALGNNLSTLMGNTKLTMRELSSKIIETIKEKTEKQFDCEIHSIVVGRPVKFHDTDVEKDKLAENDLRLACSKAGFKNISFLAEPIGGIYGSLDNINFNLKSETIVLICDLGGGTSDFSIAKISKNGGEFNIDILSNDGIYIGGDEITGQLIVKGLTPYLGKGSNYKIGNQILQVPMSGFSELKYWNRINNLQTGNHRKAITSTAPRVVEGTDKTRYNRMLEISDDVNKGYKLWQLANKLKIEISSETHAILNADMFKEPLIYKISRTEYENMMSDIASKLNDCMNNTLTEANIHKEKIDQVILIGGTSQIPFIQNAIVNNIGKGKIVQGDTYNSVAKGLTAYAKKIYS